MTILGFSEVGDDPFVVTPINPESLESSDLEQQTGLTKLSIFICYVLSELDHMCLPTDADRFRIYFHENSNYGLRDLYDVVGLMKLLNGQSLTHRPALYEVKYQPHGGVTITKKKS
ncbi:unnamed protein product [Eruca vesicaria subsp. sativa]|uniref:Uncharacterized protein n=1 Tax=Eruca vesicaria subsp. sativa TaxID=29727 RepID=A0ABC8M1U9_ERUVS|nr:unnamed protein product [Eruca vesicaria subsp. sativa]